MEKTIVMRLGVIWLLIGCAGSSALAGEAVETRPVGATEYVEATTADFGVWFNPKEWKRNLHPADLFSLQFDHGGNVGAILNAGRLSAIKIGSVAEYALRAVRATSPLGRPIGIAVATIIDSNGASLSFNFPASQRFKVL